MARRSGLGLWRRLQKRRTRCGASLVHTHSQLIATDILPADIARATERMELFENKESACLFCRMAEDELDHMVRIVEQTPNFIAFCPFASRFPSMVTILPTNHQPRFQTLSESELEQLSWLTHRMVRRIEHCYPDAAYNFIIHTAFNRLHRPDSFHWRIELFPRITKVAGFEWGSDCYINPLAPETAAAALAPPACKGVNAWRIRGPPLFCQRGLTFNSAFESAACGHRKVWLNINSSAWDAGIPWDVETWHHDNLLRSAVTRGTRYEPTPG
ncbi:MAG: DUF4921 family protein [Pirellulaceae bacterium]